MTFTSCRMSHSRPGVATRTSTPRSNILLCFCADMPPTMAATLTGGGPLGFDEEVSGTCFPFPLPLPLLFPPAALNTNSTACQISFPTKQTTLGRNLRILRTRSPTDPRWSILESSEADLVGRETRFVRPRLKREGRVLSSVGERRVGVNPDW